MIPTSESSRSDAAVFPGQRLCGQSSIYTVLELIGQGTYGTVAKCRNDVTTETVAVKIVQNRLLDKGTQHERSMMEILSVLDPEKSNIIKFVESFQDGNQTCLAFEMLDMNLDELLEHEGHQAVPLKGIRSIAQQLFQALDALQGLGVVHGDIKPDNVMLVNHQQQPYRIKLIDFGVACCPSKPSHVVPPCGFRAPECFLGLPVREAVDMWGVGCVLAFLYLRCYIFDVRCVYKCMKSMVKVLGLPKKVLLESARASKDFFTVDDHSPTWRLLTPEEFSSRCCYVVPEEDFHYPLTSLIDLTMLHPEASMRFVDLLRKTLSWDSSERLKPREALSHPFITGTRRARNTCSQPPTNHTSVGEKAPSVDPPQTTDSSRRPSSGSADSSPASTSAETPQCTT